MNPTKAPNPLARGSSASSSSSKPTQAAPKPPPPPPPDPTTLYSPALASLAMAVTHDEQGKIAQAKHHYITAAERALLDMKRDRSVGSKTAMLKRVRGWVSRAEQLKTKEQDLRRATKGFESVMGLEHVKQALAEAVILPQTQPQLFVGERKPWRGILMYGPPGTGKSKLAEAVAHEADCTFIAISSSDIMSKGFGDSEKNIRSMFETCRESIKRTRKRCVLFIDEIDSIGASRDMLAAGPGGSEAGTRVLTELLKQMDGVGSANEGLVVVGATNQPEILDAALRRRFEKRLLVPLPEAPERALILAKLLGPPSHGDHNLTPGDVIKVAERGINLSGADLSQLANDVLMKPVRRLMKSEFFKLTSRGLEACNSSSYGAIKMRMLDPEFDAEKLYVPVATVDDALEAVSATRPSVSSQQLVALDKFTKEFGTPSTVKQNADKVDETVLADRIIGMWEKISGVKETVVVKNPASAVFETDANKQEETPSFVQRVMTALLS